MAGGTVAPVTLGACRPRAAIGNIAGGGRCQTPGVFAVRAAEMYRWSVAGETPRRCAIWMTGMSGLAISVSPLHANSSALRNAGRSVTAPDSRSVKIFLYPTSANAFRCKARFWRESGFPNRSVASLGVGEYVKGGVHLFKKYSPRTSDPFLVHPCILGDIHHINSRGFDCRA